MSSPVAKVPKKKRSSSADKGAVLSRLVGDSLVSPAATGAAKPVPPSAARTDRSDSPPQGAPAGGVDSRSRSASPSLDDVTGGYDIFNRIRDDERTVVVLSGVPPVAEDTPRSVRQLIDQGVKPLENVTINDLLRMEGASQELRARPDYPDWEHRARVAWVPSPADASSPRDSFSTTALCRNDPRLLAEIITCILLSSESLMKTYVYVDRLFRELWVFLFRTGIGADDGLALLDYADLDFPVSFAFLRQLQAKKGFWQIIRAVKLTQSVSPRLYLTRAVPFCAIMQIVHDPSVISAQGSSSILQNASRAVAFDTSVKSHAPPDLELPKLAMDAGDFLDYRKSVEYVFQSRGVKQYLTETDASQLVPSWSEAFCARLHASIAKSTISYINEQMKNESSVARLWDGIKNCFDDAGQQLDRELRTWITLFQLSVDHIDNFASFLNTYKTAMSQLRSFNSIALTDAAVMRALIIRSVTCEEFHSVMIDLSKNRSIRPEDMITALEDHYRAYQHRATIAGNSTSTKQIRRGKKDSSSGGAQEAPATKLGWRIPPFPRTLHDCIGGYVFNQLRKWRTHCTKENYTEDDEQKRREWVIYKSPPGSRQGGDGGGQGRGRDKDRDGKRGTKKNHHRTQDRRGRRGDRSSRSRSRSREQDLSGYSSYSDDSEMSYPKKEALKYERWVRRQAAKRAQRSQSPPRDKGKSPGGKDAGVLFGGRRDKS